MLIIGLQFLFLLLGVVQLARPHGSYARPLISLFAYGTYVGVSGLRWRTGTDWPAYEHAFNMLDSGSLSDLGGTFEPGYMAALYTVHALTGSFTLLLLVQSLVIAVALYRASRLFTAAPVLFLGAVLLLQSQFWYPVRQQVAISLIIWSVALMGRDSPGAGLKAWLLFVLSFALHSSALIAAPIFLLASRRRGLMLLFFLFLSVLALFYWEVLYEGFLQPRIVSYVLENEYEFESGRNIYRLTERVLSFGIAVSLVLSGAFVTREKVRNVILTCLVAGLFVSSVSLAYFPYLARFSLYFNWAEAAVLVGCTVNFMLLKPWQRAALLLWGGVVGAKFFGSLVSYWDLINPYYLVFEIFERGVY